MRRLTCLVACGLLAVLIGLVPAAASATIRYGNFSGIIVPGSPDPLGLFGGGDLDGLPITGVFSFDDNPLAYSDGIIDIPGFFDVADSTGAPLLSVTLTVNGMSRTVLGGQYQELGISLPSYSFFPFDVLAIQLVDTFSGGQLVFLNTSMQPFDPSLGLGFPGLNLGGPTGLGQFEFADPLGLLDSTSIGFIVFAVRVPEPGSLGLLAVGLAVLVLRRRAALSA